MRRFSRPTSAFALSFPFRLAALAIVVCALSFPSMAQLSNPPLVSKSFTPASIGEGDTSVLMITVTNNNGAIMTGVSFTDTYPTGVVNAATPNASINCDNLVSTVGVSATPGDNKVVVTNQTINSNASANPTCILSVDVTAPAGSYLNEIQPSDVTSTNAGSNTNTASATLTVLAHPVVTKAFAPSGIPPGGTSTLTITVTNPNAVDIVEFGLQDLLPADVFIANPENIVDNCTGLMQAFAGDIGLVYNAATISPGTCTMSVDVTSSALGAHTNTIGLNDVISSNAGGITTPASATLTVMMPPAVTKDFPVAETATNNSTALTITITNPNAGEALTGVSFTDTFPANMTNAATPTSTGCGGGILSTPTPDSIQLANATIAPSTPCVIQALIVASVGGVYTNTIPAGDVTSTNGGNSTEEASDSITFLDPPVATKSFAPTSIPVGGTSTLTITLTNPNSTGTLNVVTFTDDLPIGLENTTLGSSALCGGTLTQGANGNQHFVQLSNASIAPSGICTVTVSITGAVAGSYTNVLDTISTQNGGNTSTAVQASIDVNAGLTVAKSFSPDVIPVGTQSTLTITLTNPNAGTVDGIQFTDVYPTGINNAGTPNQSTTCTSGTATVGNNGSNDTLSLSGASLAGGQQCTVTVTVVGTTVGVHSNSIAAGDVTATNASPNSSGATGVLTVMSPPTVSSAFTPSQIPSGGTSTFSVTLSNSNTVAMTGAGFTNTFPAGVIVAPTPAANTTCGGVIVPAGDNLSFSFGGGTIPTNDSCVVSINVTSSTPGVHTNTISAGAVTTTNAGSNTAPSQAQLEVMSAPTVAKAFNPTTFTIGGTTDLTITLSNSNGSNITGVTFTDLYPTGITNAAAAATTNTCGGTVTASMGGTQLQLSGGTIPASSSCSITIPVTSTTPGPQTNTIAAGDVASANAPGNTQPATGNVTVIAPPTGTKSFTPQSILLNGTSTLTIVISNPNPTQMDNVVFTDTYPGGFQNAAAPSPTTSCGGTVTANANDTSLGFSGGTIGANGQCTITVQVIGTSIGNHINTIPIGGVTTTNFPASTAAISGTLSVGVLDPLVATKTFTPSTIPPNGTSTLTITLSNDNAEVVNGIAFTDTYPSGLTNDTPVDAATTCSAGSVTTTAGSVELSGATLAANAQCTVTVTVTAAAVGNYVNTIPAGGITATNAAPSTAPVTATLAVQLLAAPIVTKSFDPPSVGTDEPTTLTITLTNTSSAFAITGVDFTDTYPAGMTNAASPAPTTTCGGTATATPGGNSLSLADGVIPPNSTCQVSAIVSVAASGSFENIIPAGTVTSDNAQATAAAAAATLQVGTPIPALSPLALLALASLLTAIALLITRR